MFLLVCLSIGLVLGYALRKWRKARWIHTKVVGVSFPNDDGGSRQDHIGRYAKPDRLVMLVPEPYNPHDPNAVAVYIDDKQIGYIPRGLAATLRLRRSTAGFISRVHDYGFRYLGVEIEFLV
jgi:hypothetical protein